GPTSSRLPSSPDGSTRTSSHSCSATQGRSRRRDQRGPPLTHRAVVGGCLEVRVPWLCVGARIGSDGRPAAPDRDVPSGLVVEETEQAGAQVVSFVPLRGGGRRRGLLERLAKRAELFRVVD